MPKKFTIPDIYESPVIRTVKDSFAASDPMKRNMRPAVLDFGPVRFLIPRHFGFCYGVQNAIEIAYRTITENPDKQIYLLSEMIHNPTVNEDLIRRGVKFLYETDGTEIIPFADLKPDDIVIVPAFGTTLEIQKKLEAHGINPYQYDTTCPFVEKVWRRGSQLGKKGHTLVVHGKYQHEETRATFSHAAADGPVVVVFNPAEAHVLAEIMTGKRPAEEFQTYFGMKCTPYFNPVTDMHKFGVINQTTMLATETQEVMDILKAAAEEKFGTDNIREHFADTSDTLCYATNENQSATYGLLGETADLAIVVGGYNSSNTMHIVELLEKKFPTYHIRDAGEMSDSSLISHFNQWQKKVISTRNWLPEKPGEVLTIGITSGASCPDALVDEIILKILNWFPDGRSVDEALEPFL